MLRQILFFKIMFRKSPTFSFSKFQNHYMYPFIDFSETFKSKKFEISDEHDKNIIDSLQKFSISSQFSSENTDIIEKIYDRIIKLSEDDNNSSAFPDSDKKIISYYLDLQIKIFGEIPKITPQVAYKLLKLSYIFSLKIEEPLQILYRSLLLEKKITIFFLTDLLLLLQDLFRKNLDLRYSLIFKNMLEILSNFSKKLISQNEMVKNLNLYLLQILYCFVRFDFDDKKLYITLVNEIYSNKNILEKLLEIQLTSLILSLCKLELKYSKREFFFEKEKLYPLLEQKIMHRNEENLISYKRLPPILYCYTLLNRPPEITKNILLQGVKTNTNKFNSQEAGSLFFSIWKLKLYNNYELLYELIPKIEENLDKKNHFSDINLINFLIVMRGLSDYRVIIQLHIRTNLLNFQKKTTDLLIMRFDAMTDKTKLVFLYEATKKQNILKKNEIENLKYENYLYDLDLDKLNNFDLVTVAAIVIYFRNNGEKFNSFLNLLKQNLEKRKGVNQIQENRIKFSIKDIMEIIKQSSVSFK